MSAWIVSPYHVNALVTWAMHHKVAYEHGGVVIHVSPATAKILMDENVRSVNYRYSETNDNTYTFQVEPAALKLTPVEIVKSCSCLDYQSCETEDYDTTEAKVINTAIQIAALRLIVSVPELVASKLAGKDIDFATLPGYEAASWGLEAPEQNEVTK
jgi:hypothetical protein